MLLSYIFIAVTVLVSLYANSNPEFLAKCIMHPYSVQRKGEYYRFISSGFVHNGYIHLLFNMMTLYFFAPMLEIRYFLGEFGLLQGFVYFFLLYIGGIIVSDIPTFRQQKNVAHYQSLGASGGVASIIFSMILYDPLIKIYLYFAIPIPGFILGIVYVIYSYYYSKGSDDNINHSAHLYGALYGLVFSAVIRPTSVIEFFRQLATWNLFN
jgi:membrane associated rhomboid family serine protease